MTEPALPFASLFVAVVTPFDEDGKVELPVLDLIIDYLLKQRVEGLALLTEAAEDSYLLPDERRTILDRVGAKAEGKVSQLVSISAPSTREAVDLARFAESKGATGILISPLGVPGMGYRALYRHVDRVGRATSLPVFLTVRPNNAADHLTEEEQATLAQHPSLSGVFLSQPSQAELKTWARRVRKRSGVVLNGCALSFRPAAQAGATGSICALSLLAVDASRKLMDGVRRGEVDVVRRLERRVAPAVDFLGPPRPPQEEQGVKKLANKLAQRPLDASSNAPWASPALIKAGLDLQGHKRVSGRVRPPLESASRERIQRLGQVLKSAELLT